MLIQLIVLLQLLDRCVKFPLQRVSRGKLRLAAFNDPSPKPPHRRKNLADTVSLTHTEL